MKAAVLTKHGDADEVFELQDRERPTPQEGEVLLKVEGFGLNFADVMARRGLYREAPKIPCVLGYDVVGRVESVGASVDAAWVGKRVVSMTRFGGYAEYAVTKADGLAAISETMDAGEATALATQYCTAWYAACHCMTLLPGDVVLIHAAAGGVGTALVQIAKWKGCTVLGLTSSSQKMEYLRSIGVDHPINHTAGDYPEQVKKILGDQQVNAIFNSRGGKTFKQDMSLLATGGNIACYGAADRMGKRGGQLATLGFVLKMGFMSPIPWLIASRSLIGVNMLYVADHQPKVLKHCLEQVVKYAEEGVLAPKVGGVFPAADIGKAHAFLESRKSTGKIIVKW